MPTIRLKLPRPHEKQADFLYSPAKRKVVCAGRRGGKTTGMAMVAALALVQGRRVLEAAPTSDQTDAFWERLKVFAQPLINHQYVRKWESDRTMVMPSTGGRIRCKTAWDADTLRGDYADLLILDEYSIMKPDTWEQVGVPMLLDNDGDAVFIFTPKSRNHAWRLFKRAEADPSERWRAWHFTSYDNPYLSKEALAEITADMTERNYRQEVLAEFVEDGSLVFPNIVSLTTAIRQDVLVPGHAYSMGVDWAYDEDYTAIVVIDATLQHVCYAERFRGLEYTQQRDRIRAVYERFRPYIVVSEANAMGRPNNELLRASGLPVYDFVTSGPSKTKLISQLISAFEGRYLLLLDDDALINELLSYESERLTGGGLSYSAPSGMHDDFVMSLALAHHGAYQGQAGAISYVR